MPVSGLPTNSALLKMTQGSSGPSRKPFQKTASGPVGSMRAAGRTAARFRNTAIRVTTHTASSDDSAITAMSQLLWLVAKFELGGTATSKEAVCGKGSTGAWGAG